jgi:hypothetical protein
MRGFFAALRMKAWEGENGFGPWEDLREMKFPFDREMLWKTFPKRPK